MRIAVTGGIAEGKSTVMGYLREAGLQTASADEIAREVFQSDEVQGALAAKLGAVPPIEPSRLREAIAIDPALRRWLNVQTHPRILDRLDACDCPWIEVPLLIEACLQSQFDRVWVVTCGPVEQLRRLADRLGDEHAARRMIATQLPTEAKIAFADEIVRTNLSEADVHMVVAQCIERELSI